MEGIPLSLSSNEDDNLIIDFDPPSYMPPIPNFYPIQQPSSSSSSSSSLTSLMNIRNFYAPSSTRQAAPNTTPTKMDPQTLSTPSTSTATVEQQTTTKDDKRIYLPKINTDKLGPEELLMKIENENNCTICMDPFSTDNNHHIVALKCGHIFGQFCIETWLKPSAKNLRCPTCNKKATKRDIFRIYAQCLRPHDPRELKELQDQLEKLKQERNVAEEKHFRSIIHIKDLENQIEQLKLSLYALQDDYSKRGLKTLVPSAGRANNADIPVIQIDSPKFSFTHIQDLEIRDSDARLHSYCSIRDALVVTMQSNPNPLFPNVRYGLRRIQLDSSSSDCFFIHDKLIKDMFIDQCQNAVYTVSADKTMKYSSLLANNVISTIQFEHPACSVHVNPEQHPDYVYVGFNSGDMAIYDRRNFAQPLDRYSPITKRPVVSIQSLPGYANSEKGDSLVLALQSSSSQLYHFGSFSSNDPDELSNAYSLYRLPYDGKLSNASYDRQSNRIMVSCRISIKHSSITHYVFNYDKGFTTPNQLSRLQGGKIDTIQSRSKLFSHPGHEELVIAGAGDQAAKGARFWNSDTSTDYVDIKTRDTVRDIEFINSNNRPIVSCLTDSVVKLYSLQ